MRIPSMPGSSTPPPKAGYMAATDSLPSFHSSVANAGRTDHTYSCRQPSRERRAGLRRALRPVPSSLTQVATGSYVAAMRSVGLKTLNNKLSEYVRLAAAGETVLVTDRDRVVAEIVPPRVERSPILGRRGNRSAEGGAEPHSGRRHAGRCGTKGLAEAPGGARLGASSRTTADHVAGPASPGAGRG